MEVPQALEVRIYPIIIAHCGYSLRSRMTIIIRRKPRMVDHFIMMKGLNDRVGVMDDVFAHPIANGKLVVRVRKLGLHNKLL